MPDQSKARTPFLATRFEGFFQRAAGWFFLAVGLGALVAGVMALIMIPSMTMPDLPPYSQLPRLSGIVIDVVGVRPGAETEKNELRQSKVQLKVKANGAEPVWISLGIGYFVARDLERRCGLGDYNLDTIRGRPVEVVHDGKLQAVELRIGRILCVKAASGDRESIISNELRRRSTIYAPVLFLCGGLMAGAASLMLGLWDKNRA